MKNVFVLGPDEINRRTLAKVGEKMGVKFHELLDGQEVCLARHFDFQNLLDKAQAQLDSFSGEVDGILALWDFPSTLLQPILARRNGLNGPAPEAVLRCEHKWWSREIQNRVVPQLVPDYQTVDPFEEPDQMDLEVDTPYWIKPIKAHSSNLGFAVSKESHLPPVLKPIRKGIGRFGDPFDQAMEILQAPLDLLSHGGKTCLVESIIGGFQCTAEGYVQNGEVKVYGIIDSHRYPDISSFHRYQYPSTLPDSVKQRIRENSRVVIQEIGLDNSCFNIEFFYDKEEDRLSLLEINPRCSQSHADMFEKVDGSPHQVISVALCLGDEVEWKEGNGKYKVAAKFFLRRFEDGLVDCVPTERELREIMSRHPDSFIDLQARPKQMLSDQVNQDSYSFEVARVYLGADSEEELLERYEDCEQSLNRLIHVSASDRLENAS
jgi:hypothetical protein